MKFGEDLINSLPHRRRERPEIIGGGAEPASGEAAQPRTRCKLLPRHWQLSAPIRMLVDRSRQIDLLYDAKYILKMNHQKPPRRGSKEAISRIDQFRHIYVRIVDGFLIRGNQAGATQEDQEGCTGVGTILVLISIRCLVRATGAARHGQQCHVRANSQERLASHACRWRPARVPGRSAPPEIRHYPDARSREGALIESA